MKILPQNFYRELYELFSSITNEREAQMILEDIATPQEIDDLAQRWQLIKQLATGKPQRDIAKDLGISISKITRGSHMLQRGHGGFAVFLNRLKETGPGAQE